MAMNVTFAPEESASAFARTVEEDLNMEQNNSPNLTPPKKKNLKKAMSVRFVPEMSPCALARTVVEEAMADDDSNIDLNAKIYNYLPSNTLHRRKQTVVVPSKSYTVPRRVASSNVPSATRMRNLLHPTKMRRILSQQVDSSDLPPADWSEEVEKEIEMPDTEEGRINDLLNLRSLPIKLEDKKLYRNTLLQYIRTPQLHIKAKKKSCSDTWSSFFEGCSSRCQLWSRTLKKIEGQFGTGVVSYFVFLRWLILLNFVIFVFYFFLIILPYSSFPLLTHRNTKLAPNETSVTEELLQRFPSNKDVTYASKRTSTKNASSDFELFSNLGTLLDNTYLPNNVQDFAQYDKRNFTGKERKRFAEYCETEYKGELANHTTRAFSFIQDFLQGTGWLQSTVLFLGFYPDRDVSYFGLPYNLPVAFIAALVASFLLSLVLMLQYSSHGIQESVLTRKSNYLTFSNILFCSWDYCIEDKKTAAIRHKGITCEIKSNLAEEHRKLEVSHWSSEKRMKVYTLRVIINILVIAALFGCFYLIYMVVNIQLEKQRMNDLNDSGVYTLFIQFLSPLVITGLNIVMPIIFYNVVKFEMYDTQTQVNIALFRIVFLRLASVFVLVSSLQQQITCEPKDVCKKGLTNSCRSPRCWETYVGQQLYKLVITDFLVYVFMFLGYDLPRDLIVRNCKCKVSEVVGRQVFDLPSQVLSLVYSQTLSWLGLFYSPLLPGISVLKFLIIFYIKKVVVLKHCVPAPVLYKASRSNSMFMTILMISLFFATVIYGYCLTSIEPSLGCSPFRQQDVMVNAVAEAISEWSPNLVKFMTFLFSGFFFLPAFFLFSLIVYYYWTVIVAQRKMFKLLKGQIAVEGRDKQFLLNRLSEAARQCRLIAN